MTEADILAMTYDDSCTVYRPGKVTLPSGESVFKKGLEGRMVYEDTPCALSSPSGGKLAKSQTVARVDTDYLLFVRPEVDIQPGLVSPRVMLETSFSVGATWSAFSISSTICAATSSSGSGKSSRLQNTLMRLIARFTYRLMVGSCSSGNFRSLCAVAATRLISSSILVLLVIALAALS